MFRKKKDRPGEARLGSSKYHHIQIPQKKKVGPTRAIYQNVLINAAGLSTQPLTHTLDSSNLFSSQTNHTPTNPRFFLFFFLFLFFLSDFSVSLRINSIFANPNSFNATVFSIPIIDPSSQNFRINDGFLVMKFQV